MNKNNFLPEVNVRFFKPTTVISTVSRYSLLPLILVSGTALAFDYYGVAINQSSQYLDVKLADLDGDGDLDAFFANRYGNQVWLNDGRGNFTDTQQRLGNDETRGISLADVDNDGDIDAMSANFGVWGSATAANKVWLNDGSGVFSDSGQRLGESYSFDSSFGDIDNDGDLDAVVANVVAPNEVWINNGHGKFHNSGQQLGYFNSQGIVLADIDDDGDVDIVVANKGQVHVWYKDEFEPLITSDPIIEITAGENYNYTVVATDEDDEILTYELTTAPEWLAFDGDNTTLTGTPSDTDIGTHTVALDVSDGRFVTSQQYALVVNATTVSPALPEQPEAKSSDAGGSFGRILGLILFGLLCRRQRSIVSVRQSHLEFDIPG